MSEFTFPRFNLSWQHAGGQPQSISGCENERGYFSLHQAKRTPHKHHQLEGLFEALGKEKFTIPRSKRRNSGSTYYVLTTYCGLGEMCIGWNRGDKVFSEELHLRLEELCQQAVLESSYSKNLKLYTDPYHARPKLHQAMADLISPSERMPLYWMRCEAFTVIDRCLVLIEEGENLECWRIDYEWSAETTQLIETQTNADQLREVIEQLHQLSTPLFSGEYYPQFRDGTWLDLHIGDSFHLHWCEGDGFRNEVEEHFFTHWRSLLPLSKREEAQRLRSKKR